MDQYEGIIINIQDTFIDMNKSTITEDKINIFCDKHKQILNEIDQAYCCTRSLDATNNLMSKKMIMLKILCSYGEN